MNTEQSPATASTAAAQRSADTKRFREAVKSLKTEFRGLMELATQVGGLGANQALPAVGVDGRPLFISRKQLTTLKSQFADRLDDLTKMFTEATKKKKRASTPGVGPTSVLNPQGELINFLNNADLGPAYTIINGACVEDGQLRDKLGNLLQNGVYGGRMLPILFSVYARYHGMQLPDRPSIYVATDEMRQFLTNTFEELRQDNINIKPRTKRADKRDVEEGLATKTGQNIAFPPFSADQMLFYDFPRIISKNTVDKKNLDPAYRTQIDSAEFKEALRVEYDAVAQTLECLKAISKAEKEANAPPKRTTRRRQTSPAAQGPLPPVVQPMQGRTSPTGSVSSGRSSPIGSVSSGRSSPTGSTGRISPIPNIQGINQGTVRRTVPGMLPNIGSNVIGGEEEE